MVVVGICLCLMVVTTGCGTKGGKRNTAIEPTRPLAVNASGLEGIGDLKIGMTVKEAKKALIANNKKYSRGYSSFDISDCSPICLDGYYTEEEAAQYGYRCFVYDYYIADDNPIGIKMGFLRDTLKLMRVDNAIVCLLGLTDVVDAFTRKYGQGYISGMKKQGRSELWVGERVIARHFIRDDGKPNNARDFFHDKNEEYFIITEKGALIFQELNAIKAKIDADRLKERNKELDNI